MRHYSTTEMIKRLSNLAETGNLSDWEQHFVTNLHAHVHNGEVTKLTDAQIEKLDELHTKIFS
jgi:hypothetical protein